MTKWYFRLAVLAALAMLAIAAFMGISAPPCNPLPMSTLTAFELVRTADDIHRILGAPTDACRAGLAPQLDHANFLDMIAYIPAYTVFYGLTAWALGDRDRGLGLATVALAIVCAVADVFENIGMFTLSANPDAPTPWLPILIVATNVKWVGLAVVTALCGLMLARRGGLGWIALIACAVPLVPALWALAAPDDAGKYLIPGMTVASVMLLAVAAIGSFRSGGKPAQEAA